MLGVIINALAIVLGSAVGLLLKKGIPERVSGAVMSGVGLCILYIGIDGALEGQNAIVLIVSMVLGAVVGTLLDIDRQINRLGTWVERRMNKDGGQTGIAQGFVTASLLFCVGAMAIVGSLQSGLKGDHSVLITKSILDMISSVMLTGTLGIGVMLSAVPIFLYQGAIALAAGLLQGLLADAALVAEITCAGSLLILGLGLNMLGMTKLKVANFLPAMVFVPVVYYLVGLLPV